MVLTLDFDYTYWPSCCGPSAMFCLIAVYFCFKDLLLNLSGSNSLIFHRLIKGELDRKEKITAKATALMDSYSAIIKASWSYVSFWCQELCASEWYAIKAFRRFLLKRFAWEGLGSKERWWHVLYTTQNKNEENSWEVKHWALSDTRTSGTENYKIYSPWVPYSSLSRGLPDGNQPNEFGEGVYIDEEGRIPCLTSQTFSYIINEDLLHRSLSNFRGQQTPPRFLCGFTESAYLTRAHPRTNIPVHCIPNKLWTILLMVLNTPIWPSKSDSWK